MLLHLKIEKILPYDQKEPLARRGFSKISPSLDDIKGQERAKRALIISYSGYHNILLSGAPEAGKTILAKTLTRLLPELSKEEQVAAIKIHSLASNVSGKNDERLTTCNRLLFNKIRHRKTK